MTLSHYLCVYCYYYSPVYSLQTAATIAHCQITPSYTYSQYHLICYTVIVAQWLLCPTGMMPP